jgi:hypothetical protein
MNTFTIRTKKGDVIKCSHQFNPYGFTFKERHGFDWSELTDSDPSEDEIRITFLKNEPFDGFPESEAFDGVSNEALDGSLDEALYGFPEREALDGSLDEALYGFPESEALYGFPESEGLYGSLDEVLYGFPESEALYGFSESEALYGFPESEALYGFPDEAYSSDIYDEYCLYYYMIPNINYKVGVYTYLGAIVDDNGDHIRDRYVLNNIIDIH